MKKTVNFFEYYRTLEGAERRRFKLRVIEVCHIGYPTFYSWLHRKKVPLYHQKLIAEHIGQFSFEQH